MRGKKLSERKVSIRYRATTVKIENNPRKGRCECCGKKTKTDLHHWQYKYSSKAVKKCPELALESTTELCFHCHRIANSINHTVNHPKKTRKLRELRRQALDGV